MGHKNVQTGLGAVEETSLHGAGCGASISLEISDHWSGMLDLVQRDSQRATGDCGLGDVGFGHFSLESLESSGP